MRGKVMYTRKMPDVLLCMLVAACVYVPHCVSAASGTKEFSNSVRNVLSIVHDTLGHIQNYVEETSNCIYTCPNGSKPWPRKHYQMSSNGCGTNGFQLEKYISVRELTSCCNRHDLCYDTCNMAKNTCDSEFKQCLENLCVSAKKGLTKNGYTACLYAADVVYAGTQALGCKPYKDSQKKACTCDPQPLQEVDREL